MNTEEKNFHLNTMLNAMQEAEEYVVNMDYEAFAKEENTLQIVVRNLNVIGNSAIAVKDQVKEHFKEFDFEVLTSLANANLTAGMEMDMHGLFHIIQKDFPVFRDKFNQAMLDIQAEEESKMNLK
jgi:uncharacterized protein with HEPN domain